MILRLAAVALLAFPAVADASSVGTAKRLLAGKRFVTHYEGVDDATIDRTADLCRNGHFSYHSTFLYPGADQLQEQTVTGRWRVVSARLHGRFGKATVRWTGDDGSHGVVHFSATARGVYVEGQVAEVVAASC